MHIKKYCCHRRKISIFRILLNYSYKINNRNVCNLVTTIKNEDFQSRLSCIVDKGMHSKIVFLKCMLKSFKMLISTQTVNQSLVETK